MRRLRRADDGAGSVLVLSIAATVLLICGLLLPLYMALSAKRVASGAADAAALAAADGLSGAVPGFPCELAEQVAALNGAVVVACEVSGSNVTVVVAAELAGLPIEAAARAGPPPDDHRHAEQPRGTD